MSFTKKPMLPKKKLSMKIRIIVGLFSLPSIALASMLIYAVMHDNAGEIGGFEIVYAFVGVFAMYIALTGKRFF